MTKIYPHRISDSASAAVNLNEYTMADALRAAADWLDENPLVSLRNILTNWGEHEDDCYVEFFFEGVEDDDL